MSQDDNCLEWLRENIQLDKNNNATFVECLRWMRIPQKTVENKKNQVNIDTKLKLLQIATEKANNFTKSKEYLEKLNNRTEKIAGEGNTFEAKCSWRMRVGGQRGAENILLPAFDALGIPYIPSSALRGIARSQALWELKDETEVAKYFGSLEAENLDKMGKVIFLDAYPLAKKWQTNNLSLDIANNIWHWKDNNSPEYSPNPNTFISLKETTFLIGLRPTNEYQTDYFNKVINWLKKGLQSGIGSQINSGYGVMILKSDTNEKRPFLEIDFTLQGQCIHSYPIVNSKNKEPEVRPIAFKSMLRYWFRTIAFGFLSSQNVKNVKYWESKLFGSIDSQTKAYGWVKFQISDSNKVSREQNKDRPCETQRGKLTLYFSREIPQQNKETVEKLFNNLAWLMFHLGGVGQGARRPLYDRRLRNNPKPPYYRGSKLRVTNNVFEKIPATCEEFKSRFQSELASFYEQLAILTSQQINSTSPINSQTDEAIDRNCKIFVCQGEEEFNKTYALAILHSEETTGTRYDRELCGGQSLPSPIWIAGLDNYQIVTIFGANNHKRQQFINKLKQDTDRDKCLQIFPIHSQ
jgi:CRISPR-associated protein Cmr6